MKKTLKNGAFLLLVFALVCIMGCSDGSSPSPKSDKKSITSFIIGGKAAAIAEVKKEISITLPGDTDLQTIKPEIKISSKAKVSPASGEEVDFTNPVTYLVTAQNGSTQPYTVTVTLSPITTLSLVLTAQLVENGDNGLQVYGVPEDGIKLSTGKDGPSLLVISVGGTADAITDNAVYTEVYWYIDGVQKDSNQNIISLSASDYAYTIPHDLTVIVVKDGVKYSKALTFTVGREAGKSETETETETETGETP